MSRTERVVCGIDFSSPYSGKMLQAVKNAGMTSVQIYTFWKFFEPEARGKFDWSYFDAQVKQIQAAGLKWVPFLLIGPAYAMPDWWLQDSGHVGLRCLEHDKDSPIESIWNPAFRVEIDRIVAAFAEHYRDWNVIESLQPGICGDYGEAIMPVHGNWPGAYHTHRGFWAGDRYARADFSRWCEQRFGSVQALNQAWRTGYSAWEEVKPFLAAQAPSRTAWFDFIEWYRGSMTEFVDFWMGCVRKHFPDTQIYMCTGGMEEPEHATNFSQQAKICAKHGGGLRLTNEANRYFHNFFVTAYTHSACQFYGARLGLEPVGPLTDEGIAARIFGSADYGNEQIFFYFYNLFREIKEESEPFEEKRTEVYKRYIDLVEAHEMSAEVAVFWPELVGAMGDGVPLDLKPLVTYLRQRLPVMPVSDSMILDGALKRYRVLIVPMTAFARREVLIKIAGWVRAGGVLFALGDLTDVELERVAAYDELFGINPEAECAKGLHAYQALPCAEFPKFSRTEAFTGDTAYLNLTPDTEILARVVMSQAPVSRYDMPRPDPNCAVAFRRKSGAGTAIRWCGPMNFEYDAQSLFRQPVVMPMLLDDVLELYTSIKPWEPSEAEVVRGRIQNREYVLTADYQIKALEK